MQGLLVVIGFWLKQHLVICSLVGVVSLYIDVPPPKPEMCTCFLCLRYLEVALAYEAICAHFARAPGEPQ